MKINKLQSKQKLKFTTGFTLVETMVAVFILTIALTSLLNLTSQSLFTARYARNEITANYLLQEVVDYVRNQRDSTAFQQKDTGGGWLAFLDKLGKTTNPYCFSAEGCYFDVSNVTNPIIRACSSGSGCPSLMYDDSDLADRFYNYNSGSTSSFKRTIVLDDSNSDELSIKITVEWMNGNSLRSRVLRMSLLNWAQ